MGYIITDLPLNVPDFIQNIRVLNRNRNMEKKIIQASRIEKYLRDVSGTSKILEAIAGNYIDGDLYCCGHNIHICPQTPADGIPHGGPFTTQPFCEPQIMVENIFKSQPYIFNGSPMLHTPFTFLRISHLTLPISRSYSNSIYGDNTMLSMDDIFAANYLGRHLDIDGDWLDESPYDGPWRRAYIDYGAIYDQYCGLIPVKDGDGTLAYVLEVLPYKDQAVILPVAFYQRPGFSEPLRLYIPPEPPFQILGADMIADTQNQRIILSEEPAMLQYNNSFNNFVHGVILNPELINYTDITPLRGKKVTWVMCDWDGEFLVRPKKKYQIAMKIALHMAQHNIPIDFIDITDISWNPAPMNFFNTATVRAVNTMTFDAFLKFAAAEGVIIPNELRKVEINSISGDELEKKERPPYLITPVIREGSGTVCFGATGVAKSWFALSIACALAHGKSVFSSHWLPMDPSGSKALIIAGEMDEGEYGERVKLLHRHYASKNSCKRNLILHIAEQLDLAGDDGEDRILKIISDSKYNHGVPGDPVKLVVLDNLTTLSIEGENPANFGRIEHVLRVLKDQGIAVILIHHENNQGDIRGARKISDVMSAKFHLYRSRMDGDKIAIIIKNEKCRSCKQSDVDTFKVVFDFSNPKVGWAIHELSAADKEQIGISSEDELDSEEPEKKIIRKTKYKQPAWKFMTDQERFEAIRIELLEGTTNDQIAANHATSKSVICEFRKVHGLRDKDLKPKN